MSKDAYLKLAEFVPLYVLTENIIAVNEDFRKVSSIPAVAIPETVKYFEILDKDLTNTQVLPSFLGRRDMVFTWSYRLLMKNPAMIVESSLKDIKESMESRAYLMEEALTEHLSRLKFFKSIKKMGLEHAIDVHPVVFSHESPGMPPQKLPKTIKDVPDFFKNLTPLVNPDVNAYLFMFKGEKKHLVKKKLEELKDINRRKWDLMKGLFMTEKSARDAYKWAEKTGELLEYPACCTFVYAQQKMVRDLALLRKKGLVLSKEHSVALEFLFSGAYHFLAQNLFKDGKLDFGKFRNLAEEHLPREFYSKFVTRFFPCTIKCERAISKGQEMESLLESIDERFAVAYRMRIIGEQLTSMASEIKIHQESKKIRLSKRHEIVDDLIKTYKIKDLPAPVVTISERNFNPKLLGVPFPFLLDTLASYLYFKGKDVEILNRKSLNEMSKLYKSIYSP